MSKRRAVRVGLGVAALAVAAVLFPGSPVYLPELIGAPHEHEGKSARDWRRDLAAPDADDRRRAIAALGTLGSEEAIPDLAKAVASDPDAETRCVAALALMKLAPASRSAAAELGIALADEEPLVRVRAALALFRLKTDARPALGPLLAALADERNDVYLDQFTFTTRELAAVTVGMATTGTDEGVAPLTDALRTASSLRLQRAIAQGLGEVGPPARPAAPMLWALLADPNDDVRWAATEAVQRIGAPPPPAPPPEHHELPKEEQTYLWEVENRGNVLSKHGFGPLAQALKSADAAALSRLLADDFAGTDLADPVRVRSDTPAATVERLQDAGKPPSRLDRAAFVARLLEFRAVFAGKPPGVKLALMTLRPRDRAKPDGPWDGMAQLRLHGEHAPGAPAEVVAYLRYEVPRPTETTLTAPGWLKAAGVTQVAVAKSPAFLFADVTRARGLDDAWLHDNWTSPNLRITTGGVYVCDFDRDGLPDVLVTDINGVALYHYRPGGRFENVTADRGLSAAPLESLVAGWIDIDGDGWEDLILGATVYRNERGRFTNYTHRSRLRLPRDANNLVVADYDRDGKLDVYATRSSLRGNTSWLDGRTGDFRGNHLLRNKGGWEFEDVTLAAGALGGFRSTFSAAWLDANNDGWPDLHVPNEFGDGALLVNNQNGTFTERPLADRMSDFGTMGLAVGDVNNDGNVDIYCNNMYSKAGTRVIGNLSPTAYPAPVMEKFRRFVAGSQLHLNRGDLTFEQVGPQKQVAAVGWAYGAALADLDNDGFLDVYATAGFVSRDRNEPDG